MEDDKLYYRSTRCEQYDVGSILCSEKRFLAYIAQA